MKIKFKNKISLTSDINFMKIKIEFKFNQLSV